MRHALTLVSKYKITNVISRLSFLFRNKIIEMVLRAIPFEKVVGGVSDAPKKKMPPGGLGMVPKPLRGGLQKCPISLRGTPRKAKKSPRGGPESRRQTPVPLPFQME